MSNFNREQRYYVFKASDIERYCGHAEAVKFAFQAAIVDQKRAEDGRPPMSCVVVESDWPEYEPTWRAIEDRVAREKGGEG